MFAKKHKIKGREEKNLKKITSIPSHPYNFSSSSCSSYATN